MKFPSKTFLVGEYSVLQWNTAVMIGHAPHFSCTLDGDAPPFHPDSPAARFLAQSPARLTFQDPHGGKGGFGGSGAEFLSALFALDQSLDPWQAWDASRAFPGSGADILTQAYGIERTAPFLLYINTHARTLEPLPTGRLGLQISLFHTGRKVPTHGQSIPKLPQSLAELVEETAESLRASSSPRFVAAIKAYGKALAALSLLTEENQRILTRLPREKVLAAKGCGAMGSDTLLVVHEGAALKAWAEENSLAPVSELTV